MATHCSILSGESHGQRSLAGYGPQGHKELDMPEATYHIIYVVKKYMKRQIKRVNTIFPTVVTSQETGSEKGPDKFPSIDVTFRIKI